MQGKLENSHVPGQLIKARRQWRHKYEETIVRKGVLPVVVRGRDGSVGLYWRKSSDNKVIEGAFNFATQR